MLGSGPSEFRNAVATADCVCCFGLGRLFFDCFDQIVLMIGRKPDVLCDNAPEKLQGKKFGVPCISTKKLKSLGNNTVFIISVRNYEDIHTQLTSLGFGRVYAVSFERHYDRVADVIQLGGDHLQSVQPILSIQQKWVMVTGASRGIGRTISLALADLGANLILHSKKIEHTKAVADLCRKKGVQVSTIGADLSSQIELGAMVQWLKYDAPSVDILYNNAAISAVRSDGLANIDAEFLLSAYRINTIAPIQLSLALIPRMTSRGFGRIVNISSSIQNKPDAIAYSCSKAALDKFVFDLQPALRNTGVMMSLVDPGWLRTDMGGPTAPNPVESVVPGALLGAVLDGDVSGRWFFSQDYAGLRVDQAASKALFIGAYRPHRKNGEIQ